LKPEELVKGAYDVHVHAGPDVVSRKQDLVELARAAGAAGMAGVVLKDHTTSTVGRVYALNRLFPDGPKFFGCVALNPPVGGLNPSAAESALREGAKIVYLPTYGAQNHIRIWGAGKPPTAFPLPEGHPGDTVVTESGDLRPECDEVLNLVVRFDAVLATGHIAPEESLAVLRRARDLGVKQMLVTHASEPITPMTPDQQEEAVSLGAVIEHCFFAVTESCPGAIAMETIRDQVRHVGAESVVLSTDFGQAGNPAPVEGFAHYLGKLRSTGLTDDELWAMTHDNPKKLLD
jgi:hypothetical protein